VGFRNARNILKHCSPVNSYKLLLASAIITRPTYKSVWLALLRPFIREGQIPFQYRCYGRDLKANLRMAELDDDMQIIWEQCVRDVYEVDLNFAPDLVMDGGGNTGLFTMRMSAAASSSQNPQTKFVIVEPLPRNTQQIQKNFEINGIDAEIMPVCLGGSRRTIPFYCREAMRSSFDSNEAYTQVIDMPVVTIQDAIGSSPAERILVKIDIEGMEIEALKTFIPEEKRAVYILGELHNYQRDLPLMENLFRSHGWKLSFFDIYDNLAQFRACSPAAAPLLPSMNLA
jgi:FkbM family methyltransferase